MAVAFSVKTLTRFAALTAITVLLSTSAALALSCAQREMTSDDVERAKAIFVGTAVEEKALGFVDSILSMLGLSNVVMVFQVEMASKGVEDGETVEVGADRHLGPYLEVGRRYYVFAETRVDGILHISPCGFTEQVR